MLDASVLLGELAEEFSRRVRQGQLPEVEEYAVGHPELAERIRALFPTLLLLEGMAAGGASASEERRPLGANLTAGTTFGGYRIEREVGRGGMGVVHEAVHLALNRRVALKVLPVQGPQQAGNLERFLREAQTAAGLHHTNIVPVFDVGQVCGVPYYAMQFIDGQGLDQFAHGTVGPATATWTSDSLPPTPPTAPGEAAAPSPSPEPCRWVAEVGAQTAEGLAYAHQRGVIHRDIKPSNLLLDKCGVVWITDFGLARRLQDFHLTHSGAVVGTPCYMSPEQAEAARRPVDHRTDVYSLGATLYELLTRQAPFRGDNLVGVLLQVVEREPVPLRRLNPAVPRDLETIVLKAMAKRPEDRYATAQELADDLRRFLRLEPVRARRIGPLGRTVRWCRRNPALAAVTAAAALVIVSLSGFYYASLLDENERTRDALVREQRSLVLEKEARGEAEDQGERAGDRLLQSLYEVARIKRVLQQTGRRWEILDAMREAEQLRARPRKKPVMAGLPSRADLRSEAMLALCGLDARVIQQPASPAGTSWALSPDGRLALSFTPENGTLVARLRDISDGSEQPSWSVTPEFQGTAAAGGAIALDLPGKLLATEGLAVQLGARTPLYLWEVPGGKLLRTLDWPKNMAVKPLPGPSQVVNAVAPLAQAWPLASLTFSPDGQHLVGLTQAIAAGRFQIETVLWSLKPGGRSHILARSDMDQIGVRPVFNGDSTLLAYPTHLYQLALWDLKKETLQTAINLTVPVSGTPAFDPSGRWLVVPFSKLDGSEEGLLIWDLESGREYGRWPLGAGLNLQQAAVSFRHDGELLALLGPAHTSIYQFFDGRKYLDLETSSMQQMARPNLFWQGDGKRLVTFKVPGGLKVWELGDATPYAPVGSDRHRPWTRQMVLLGMASGPGLPATLPWGLLAVGAGHGSSDLGPLSGFAWSRDGKWLALTDGDRVQVLDAATLVVERTFSAPLTLEMRFRSDGRQLLAFGGPRVVAWDMVTGHEVAAVGTTTLTQAQFMAAIMPNMQIAGGPLAMMGAEAFYPCAGFADGDRILALRTGTQSAVVDLRTGKAACSLASGGSRHLAPDGRLILVMRAADLPVPQILPGTCELPGPGLGLALPHGYTDGGMTASDDGRWLAVNIQDDPTPTLHRIVSWVWPAVNPGVTVWRQGAKPQGPGKPALPTLELVHEIRLSAKAVSHAFSPDGKLLAVALTDGTVQLWSLESGQEVLRWPANTAPVAIAHLAFTPDGKNLAGCDARQHYLWRLDLLDLHRRLAEIGLDW